MVTFSDYAFDPDSQSYLPVETSVNKMCVTSYSDMLAMDGTTEKFTLKAKLGIKAALPDCVGLIACVGIEFYQMVGEKEYILETMCCMKVGEVFQERAI